MNKLIKNIYLFFLLVCYFILSVTQIQAQDFIWANRITGDDNSFGYGVVTDASGNVYYYGQFKGTADFDPSAGEAILTSVNKSVFIAKYDANGNYIWAKSIEGADFLNGDHPIALDGANNVYFIGRFAGTVDFDPGPGITELTATSTSDLFFAKFDSNGNFLWVKAVNARVDNTTLTLDASDNIYIGGGIYGSGTVDFDPGPGEALFSLQLNRDIFYAKYDSNGNYIWANLLGASGNEEVFSIAVDASSNLYIAGYYNNTIDFDPGVGTVNLTSNGGSDIFFAKYNVNGDYVWAKSIGGSSSPEQANSIVLDASNNVYITGSFRSQNTDFDPGVGESLIGTTASTWDRIFLAKYDNNGNYIWANQIGGDGISGYPQKGKAICIDEQNNVYISGQYSGINQDFDPGINQALRGVTFGFYTYSNIFFAKYNTNGNFQWANVILCSVNNSIGSAITIDNAGKLLMTGDYSSSSTDFDPGQNTYNMTGNGSSSTLFFAKYNSCVFDIDYTINNVTCNGGSDGSASVEISGSTAPFTYNWSTGETTNSISNKTAGNYYVTISDNSSCQGEYPIALTQPTVLAAPFSQAATNIGCTLFDANWNVVAAADSYFLDVATDAGFTSYVAGYQNLNVGNVLTYTVSSLNPSTTYYYRVRSYNVCGESSNSSSRNLTTTPPIPDAPVSSAATEVGCEVFKANWASSTNALEYFLDVSTVSDFSSFVSGYNNLNVGNVTNYVVSGISSGTIYYYRVRAGNICGVSTSSSIQSVSTTSEGAGTPTSLAATLVNFYSFQANWNTNFNVTTYYLDVAIDAGFTSFVSGYNNLNVGFVSSLIVNVPDVNTTYYYRVRAENICGLSASSTTRSLTTSKPTTFSPKTGPAGTTVIIDGSGFNTTLSNNLVYFGAVKATVTAATTTQLTVVVPSGATYDPITISNRISGKVCKTNDAFNITYDCGNLDENLFNHVSGFTVGSVTLNGFAFGDLDADGKPDVVCANNSNSTIYLRRNTSTPGNVSFTSPSGLSASDRIEDMAIVDIDGDGNPDIVGIEYSANLLSVFRHNATATSWNFAARVSFSTGSNPRERIAVADIDNDGKIDVILSNTNSSSISIFRNTSSIGSISFADRVDIFVGSSRGVYVADFDGDFKPDIALNSYGHLKVLKNTSFSGVISFDDPITYTSTNSYGDIMASDIDGDGKQDIVISNFGSNYFSIYRNISTFGNINFDTRIDYNNTGGPANLAINDVDGDGKVDIVCSMNRTPFKISIYKNTSTVGNISLESPVDFTSGEGQVTGVFVGDVDTDGLPDVIFANGTCSPSCGYVGVLLNTTSPVAVLENITNATGCSNSSTGEINISVTGGTSPYTFSWSNGATTQNITGLDAGNYDVTVMDQSSCEIKKSYSVSVSDELSTTIISPQIFCPAEGFVDIGGSLTVSGGTTPYTYNWQPSGSLDNNTLANPSASPSVSTMYTLTVTDDVGCLEATSINIIINDLAEVSNISVSNITSSSADGQSEVICEGTSSVTQKGACWNTSTNPTIADNITNDGNGLGAIISTLSGLNPATQYFVRAYAQNTSGVEYGDEVSFYTLATEPTSHVGSFTASNETFYSVDLSWTQSDNTSGYLILYKVESTPSGLPDNGILYTVGSIIGDGIVGANIPDGTTTTATISNLLSNTNYYFVIIPYNRSGAIISTTNYFTTPTIPSTNTTTLVELCIESNKTITNATCYGESNAEILLTPSGGIPKTTYEQIGFNTASNSTTTYPAVYGNYYWGAKHQLLIRASEITQVNTAIGSLAFNVVSLVTTPLQNFSIRMKNTSTTIIGTTFESGTTVVFSRASYTPTSGWNTHVFDTPFEWDGTSNILIEICFNNSSYTTNCGIQYTATSFFSSLHVNQDNSTVCSATSGTRTYNRANVRLGYGYNYQWSNSATTSQVTGLAAGTYSVTIDDSNGCNVVESITVTQPDQLIINEDVTGTNCFGSFDGSITASVTGGTEPYMYIWNDAFSQTTETATGLSSSNYIVTVTDMNDCVAVSDLIFVPQPDELLMNLGALAVSCVNSCDATAEADPFGGTIPYSYLWNDAMSQTNQTAENLCAGNYTVTVTDINGCSNSLPIDVVVGPSSMSGTYYVGVSQDFETITEALEALQCRGISDVVYIMITPGVYEEQITIENIQGLNFSNNVIFQSSSYNREDVIIQHYSLDEWDNYVVRIKDISHIEFYDLTFKALNEDFGGVILFEGENSYIQFSYNKFVGIEIPSETENHTIVKSTGKRDLYISFSYNIFENGSKGVDMKGENIFQLDNSISFNYNTFTNQFYKSIMLTLQENASIYGNNFTSNNTSVYYAAIELVHSFNFAELTRNKIYVDGNGIGIYLDIVEGPAYVTNNMIRIGLDDLSYGIGLTETNNAYIYHNTVLASSSETNFSSAFYINGGSYGTSVANNIFANNNNGFAITVGSVHSLDAMDYNNLYTSGGNIGKWAGDTYDSFSSWQSTVSPFDMNSINVDPVFLSINNLKLQCGSPFDLMSPYITGAVYSDIDGMVRGDDPWMGAHENSSTPMQGTYYIGGVSFDYESPKQFFEELSCRGADNYIDAVIREGVYNEQIIISDYIGSDFYKVNVYSEAYDRSTVEINYDAVDPNDDFIISLDHAKNIEFYDITFRALDLDYGVIVDFNNGGNQIAFTGCDFISTSTIDPIITSHLFNDDDLEVNFNYCNFEGGDFGLHINGHCDSLNVNMCTFTNQQSGAIYLQSQSTAKIYANQISSNTTQYGYIAIESIYGGNGQTIAHNNINLENVDGVGIILSEQTEVYSPPQRTWIYNNMINVLGTSISNGIFIGNSAHVNVLFNSVRVEGLDEINSNAMYFTGPGDNLSILNNQFTNFGVGYAVYYELSAPSSFFSDYNNLFSTGSYFGYISSNRNDLTSWQTSGYDANSVSMNPQFQSETNLRLKGTSPYELKAGYSMSPNITTDIDNNERSATPWIGAYEVPVYYWVGDGGNWDDNWNHWSSVSGSGNYFNSPPKSTDIVIFDANSFTGAGQIINMNVNGECGNIKFEDVTKTPTIIGTGSLIIGN
jgi:hypothetical protein